MNEILEAALTSLLATAWVLGVALAMIELVRDIRNATNVIHIDASSEKDPAEQAAEAREKRRTGFSAFVAWASRRPRMWWTFVVVGAVVSAAQAVEVWLVAIETWIGALA